MGITSVKITSYQRISTTRGYLKMAFSWPIQRSCCSFDSESHVYALGRMDINISGSEKYPMMPVP